MLDWQSTTAYVIGKFDRNATGVFTNLGKYVQLERFQFTDTRNQLLEKTIENRWFKNINISLHIIIYS